MRRVRFLKWGSPDGVLAKSFSSMTVKQAVCLAALVHVARAGWSCDLCSIYSAMEAQSGSGEGWFGGVAEQFTYFNQFQSGGHDAPNSDAEHLSSLVSQAFVGYNVNNQIGLQLTVPMIYRGYARAGAHGSEFGLGD